MNRSSIRSRSLKLAAIALAMGLSTWASAARPVVENTAAAAASSSKRTYFEMQRSAKATAANCLAYARAEVSIHSLGPVEVMDVFVHGLPPDTDFDFFVIQVPNAPFGMAWYQGDIETNKHGRGHQSFTRAGRTPIAAAFRRATGGSTVYL